MAGYKAMGRLLPAWLRCTIFIAAAGLFAVLVRAQPVSAGSSTVMPNSADFTAGTAVFMEVARIGAGNGLDAPQSQVRIYLPPSSGGSGQISILHADHCTGSGIDSNVYAPTQYVIYSVAANDATNWGDVRAVYNTPGPNPAGCGGYRTLAFSGLTASTVQGGYRGWYVAEFYATHIGAIGGVNGFQMRLDTAGLIGYSKGATSKFALQDRVNAANSFSHFTMTFAPDCALTVPTTRLLEWFDDDWGGLQTNLNYYTDLIEYNAGGAETGRIQIYPRQGNNQPGSASVTIRPNHKYAWIWYNVIKTNGIQFKLPYDSINYDLPCPPPPVPPTIWDYHPRPPIGPADTATGPKPGTVLAIRGPVQNTGNGTGRTYTHRIMVGPSPTGPWTTTGGLSSSQGGIGAVATRTLTLNYRIPATAKHGSRVCFLTSANPVTGQSTPTSTITNNGPRFSTPICYTIYNLRFELENDPNISLPGSAGAGETITAGYSINNSDGGELPSTATGGPTPSLNVRAQVTTGNAAITTAGAASVNTGQISWSSQFQRSFSVRINTNVRVGDNVCVRVFVNWEQGYSDGTSLANNPVVDDTLCFDVSDGPYLHVLEHDTWSGGGWAINGNCSVTGPGEISSHVRNRLASNGTQLGLPGVGALDEYAAFAQGRITEFGTSDESLDLLLAFANSPSAGNFGAERCIANLFDGGGTGGNIDNALWNNAQNLSSINSNTISEGQYRIARSTVSYTSNGRPFNSFDGNATILINGNFEINRNIILDSGSLALGDIPFVVFIVAGNISVADNVSRIDGVYISNGVINTCDDGQPPSGGLVADGSCDGHLEVNGSLIANEIAFRRTMGGTNEAATGNNLNRCIGASTVYNSINRRCAAETIIFQPWFWLAEPVFNRGGGDDTNQYPIQQLRDLPPIF